MNLFLYIDQETPLHRLDPRTKMFGATGLSILCLCFNHPLFLLPISLGLILLAFFSGSLGQVYRLRYLLLLLFLFSAILWPFFVKGPTPLGTLGRVDLSVEALLYGLAMGLRLSTFVIIGLIFLSTTRHEEIAHGLIRLGLPYPIAFALSAAFRLVPTFVGAGATIVQAQISRGLDVESGPLFRRLGKFIPQAVPLFVYAIRYTNLLAMSLESKGFDPRAKRTFYVELQMKGRDYWVLILLGVTCLGALWVRIGLGIGAILPGRI
ncbi:MAG: energy-coupling factor transporter transmembrane protein EcfT [Desulfobacterota bacterium]|nr:energy-coupling factor transporter transmembrane protein EcfT [Thermodesulfobacteriota bacterium]